VRGAVRAIVGLVSLASAALPIALGSAVPVAARSSRALIATSVCVTAAYHGAVAKTTGGQAGAKVYVPILRPTHVPSGWRQAQIEVLEPPRGYWDLAVEYRHRGLPAIDLVEGPGAGLGSSPMFREVTIDAMRAWISTRAWACTPDVTLLGPAGASYTLTGGPNVATLERIAASLRRVHGSTRGG